MTALRFSYPFPAVPLGEADRTFVDQILNDAERSFELHASRPALLQLCAVFLQHGSPAKPQRDSLEIAARFLHIVLCVADRSQPDVVARDAPDVLGRILGGARPSDGTSHEGGIRGAATALGRLLAVAAASRRVDLTSFGHLFRMNLATFVWAARHPQFRPDNLDAHLTVRRESICAMAYLRLWGILGGLAPNEETLHGFAFQQIELLSATVQALANDMRSVERDAREQMPNAILIVQNQQKLSRMLAVQMIRDKHDEALRALCTRISEVRMAEGDALSAPVARYLDFIGVCTRGNDTSMLSLSDRYRRA